MGNDTTDDKEEECLGREYITKVEANYCSLCREYIHRRSDEEKFIIEHCKSRRHINWYHDCKRDEERKAKKLRELTNEKDDKKSTEEITANQNGSEIKVEKSHIGEDDRDADVNLDENTNEGSENPNENSKFDR